MKKKYCSVGKFNNGYAFVRTNADTNNIGLINRDGIEVIPTEYFDIVGSVDDDFLIGVYKVMEKCDPVIDWDNDVCTSYSVYKGNIYYLLDKEGHKFRLNIDTKCKVTYESNYSDGGSHFVFTNKSNRDSKHYDAYEKYAFYPGKNFVLICTSDESYIQYFSGEIQKVSCDKLADYIEETKQLKLQRKK